MWRWQTHGELRARSDTVALCQDYSAMERRVDADPARVVAVPVQDTPHRAPPGQLGARGDIRRMDGTGKQWAHCPVAASIR